jgi:hypothetical protein
MLLVGTNTPTDGFANNEDAKMAALCQKLTAAIKPSKTIPATANVTWSSGMQAGYPAISAATALAAMIQPGSWPATSPCNVVHPLVATAVRWGAADLPTDRGRAQVDSWLFTMSGMSGEIAYPALAPSAVWNADMSKGYVTPGSIISPDGMTLTVRFDGEVATGQCGADYRWVVAESPTAVAIAVQAIPHSTDPKLACPAVAQKRQVDVTLASPLGGRVVLDATGNFTSVCPTTKPDC